MLNYTADGFAFAVPGDLDEMPLGRFLNFIESTDDSEALAAIAGVTVSDLRPLRAPDLSGILPALEYLQDLPDFKTLPAPKSLQIDGLTVVPPSNLGTQTTFSQKSDIDAAIRLMVKEGKKFNYINLSRVLLSTYLYPIVSGEKYEGQDQAKGILPLIDSLPVTDALPLAAFFLTSWSGEMRSGRLKCKATFQKRKKITLTSKLLQWFKTWQRMTLFSRSSE